MKDSECTQFLQWALPRMRLRWAGFRKVRGQVCKRIHRRMAELSLPGSDAYRGHLQAHPAEWLRLDAMCRISISRFYRDHALFKMLEHEVLPELAQRAVTHGERELRIWSAGCGSGEEPYTLALLWQLKCARRFPRSILRLLATDADANMIQRATLACYEYGSVKGLPETWRDSGFTTHDQKYCLRPLYRDGVTLLLHDIRNPPPNGPFHMILCRNLVYTYFDRRLQTEISRMLHDVLYPQGVLVVGVHETLPEMATGFLARSERLRIYARRD